MAATLCDSDAVKLKAGTNAATLTADQYTELINQAESFINTATTYNWTDAYSTLNDDVKKILEDAASSYAACSVIAYDMTGYFFASEAQTLLDVNWGKFMECLKLLKEKNKNQEFVKNA